MYVLTSEGLTPDRQRVEAITEMPQPEKPEDVLRLVQSLNSPFFPPHIGAEPGAGERRVQDNLHAHAQNEPIKNYWSQPRCLRQCVAQCLSQLAL